MSNCTLHAARKNCHFWLPPRIQRWRNPSRSQRCNGWNHRVGGRQWYTSSKQSEQIVAEEAVRNFRWKIENLLICWQVSWEVEPVLVCMSNMSFTPTKCCKQCDPNEPWDHRRAKWFKRWFLFGPQLFPSHSFEKFTSIWNTNPWKECS